ncbi:glycoside hydrolase family 130 protein [Microlunatus sp. Gsoil 973]|uniref:glycoside hydrolase family 130 protein n=1 Tax=Microlunatus sp. Gsoil 973 TaxID=2672569 RepID=UPI0012B4F21C|nr:glycoside hydrolase family 130 protein [Microlunatus sp. Gsoil 973]QGN33000.1 glycosylase [Microlunatus sp. Gsoil 973]
MSTASPRFPLGPFRPYPDNPILRPRGDSWESANLYNPAAIVEDDQVLLLYRAHADDIVSHVGLARSADGYHFDREPEPILSPEHPWESRGCEDPRVSKIDGVYYLTYTGYDGTTAQLCLATSTDLHVWTKHGPILPAGYDTFAPVDGDRGRTWSKAGVIHPQKIDGLYYLYFGEGAIFYATSSDLLHWTPCPQDRPIHTPTPGSWNERLVEIGAPPVVTDDGLLIFMINGAREGESTRVDYRCGQFAIALNDPTTVIAEMTVPWLRPQTAEELHGLVSNVTFVEGLVWFRGRWLAYYGQSDTTLAVAEYVPGRDDYR